MKRYDRSWQYIEIDGEELGEFWRGEYSTCDCCQKDVPTLCLEITEGLEDCHMTRICAECLQMMANDLTVWDAEKHAESAADD